MPGLSSAFRRRLSDTLQWILSLALLLAAAGVLYWLMSRLEASFGRTAYLWTKIAIGSLIASSIALADFRARRRKEPNGWLTLMWLWIAYRTLEDLRDVL